MHTNQIKGYRGIHSWIERRLGKPQECWQCGTTGKRLYHWANLSSKYKIIDKILSQTMFGAWKPTEQEQELLDMGNLKIQALLKQLNLEVLDRLLESLPKPFEATEQDGSADKYVHNQKKDWYNECLTEVKAIIKRARASQEKE